jgi:hypothetical protein
MQANGIAGRRRTPPGYNLRSNFSWTIQVGFPRTSPTENHSHRMAKLIVNPDTATAWEITLNSGPTSLGRGEENDFPIDHDSISTAHCQVTLSGSRVVIKDLGSRNGTFVNDELVEEITLKHGQTIRLGDVVMRFESDTPELESVIPVPPPLAPSRCKYHPRSPARYSCPKCGLSFCDLCVNARAGRGQTGRFCRTCSVECLALKPVIQEEEVEQSFPQLVRSAFVYPLKGDGIMLLVGGGIFFLLLDGARYLAKFALFYGLVAMLVLTVFGTGYLVSYLRRILTSSAAGENTMPDWPDFTDYGSDILSPFLQFLGTVMFCFAPAIVLMFAAPADSAWLGWTVFALVLLGGLYFPMAFAAVAMFDTVMAVNPLLIIPSILKIPLAYLLTILVFMAVLVVRWLCQTFLASVISPPILSWVVSGFLGLYLLVVEVRILGLLYRTKKEELGWFNH